MKNWPWYGSLVLVLIIFALVFFFYFKPKDQETQRPEEQNGRRSSRKFRTSGSRRNS